MKNAISLLISNTPADVTHCGFSQHANGLNLNFGQIKDRHARRRQTVGERGGCSRPLCPRRKTSGPGSSCKQQDGGCFSRHQRPAGTDLSCANLQTHAYGHSKKKKAKLHDLLSEAPAGTDLFRNPCWPATGPLWHRTTPHFQRFCFSWTSRVQLGAGRNSARAACGSTLVTALK